MYLNYFIVFFIFKFYIPKNSQNPEKLILHVILGEFPGNSRGIPGEFPGNYRGIPEHAYGESPKKNKLNIFFYNIEINN